MENKKVGLDAFNELAKSHDAHVKEVERLQKELDELKKLKLVDEHGETLLECDNVELTIKKCDSDEGGNT